MTPSTARHRAFTIVELLVVISIITLLIGILLPALGAARHAARLAGCKTNVRSITDAMNMYANEDGRKRYPATPGLGSYNYFTGSGDKPLESYLNQSTEVGECPLDDGTSDSGSQTIFEKEGTSYYFFDRSQTAIDNGTYEGAWGVWAIEGHRKSEVGAPSKKLLVADDIIRGSLPSSNSTNWWHGGSESEPDVHTGMMDGAVHNQARKGNVNPAIAPATLQDHGDYY